MSETSLPTVGSGASEAARKFPSLVGLVVALVVALVVMPSSLNLPQANPSTTLEFAPVPPQDDRPPPLSGNQAALGLAETGSLDRGGLDGDLFGGGSGGSGGEGEAGLEEPPPGSPGDGRSPISKKCVGSPPRQTEDPLSPPCVAHFEGDNGGATARGVTRGEIRVLLFLEGGVTNLNACRDPRQPTPDGQYFDLWEPAQPGEHCAVEAQRVWQTYFNDRYQTYDRRVHFYVYFAAEDANSVAGRKAEAAENFTTVKPFAVLNTEREFADVYLEAMASYGVAVFDARFGRDAKFFQKYPGQIWGFQPSQQQLASMYAGLLCTKVVGKEVVMGAFVGDTRTYGLVFARDPDVPELQTFKDYVIAAVKAKCKLDLSKVPTHTYPKSGYTTDKETSPTYGRTAMQDFKNKAVTTIIWPGGYENQYSKAGFVLSYFPEIIMAGDRTNETQQMADYQEQTFWDNAVAMTNVTAEIARSARPCFVAYRETDPNAYDDTASLKGCETYEALRQLFTGIQVAGPRLTIRSMDQGFHAIPAVASNDPTVPACYYDVNDYTCIKDAMLEKYDRTANGNKGCYRMIESGRRYIGGVWPEGNILAQYTPDAPCNTYTGPFRNR